MDSPGNKSLSSLIKEKAADLGFDICGIAKVRVLSERESTLKSWCEEGMNAGMSYLSRDSLYPSVSFAKTPFINENIKFFPLYILFTKNITPIIFIPSIIINSIITY